MSHDNQESILFADTVGESFRKQTVPNRPSNKQLLDAVRELDAAGKSEDLFAQIPAAEVSGDRRWSNALPILPALAAMIAIAIAIWPKNLGVTNTKIQSVAEPIVAQDHGPPSSNPAVPDVSSGDDPSSETQEAIAVTDPGKPEALEGVRQTDRSPNIESRATQLARWLISASRMIVEVPFVKAPEYADFTKVLEVVEVRDFIMLRFDDTISRFQVSDESKIVVNPVSKTELRVRALSAGIVDLRVWNNNGDLAEVQLKCPTDLAASPVSDRIAAGVIKRTRLLELLEEQSFSMVGVSWQKHLGQEINVSVFNIQWPMFIQRAGKTIDLLVGDAVFNPILDGLRDDPDGPQIDIRKDVFANLSNRLIVCKHGTLGSVVLVGLKDAKPAANVLRRIGKADPDIEVLSSGALTKVDTVQGKTVALVNGYLVIGDTSLANVVVSKRWKEHGDYFLPTDRE